MKQVWSYGLAAFLLLLCAWQHASAQVYDDDGQYVDTVFHDHINRQADDFIIASLVVCDPSDVLYSTLGHACLHMRCPAFGKDCFFSYESEGVQDKVWTFLRGDLKMGLIAWEPEEFLACYAADGRGVREYRLALSPQQKQMLWYYLDQQVDRGMALPYDFFHRGCAKAIVRVACDAVGSQAVQYANWPERFVKKTQRELVADYIDHSPWNEFILYFLVGAEADADCSSEEKLIIPTDLAEVWQHAGIDGHPLLADEANELLPSVAQPKDIWLTPLVVSLLLLVLTWFTPYPMLLVQTLLGMLMAYLVGFSALPCTDWNWLLIPFNPLLALLWHWRRYWGLPWALVLASWVVAMVAYPHQLVDWPHIILVIGIIEMLLRETDMKPLTIQFLKKENK